MIAGWHWLAALTLLLVKLAYSGGERLRFHWLAAHFAKKVHALGGEEFPSTLIHVDTTSEIP